MYMCDLNCPEKKLSMALQNNTNLAQLLKHIWHDFA